MVTRTQQVVSMRRKSSDAISAFANRVRLVATVAIVAAGRSVAYGDVFSEPPPESHDEANLHLCNNIPTEVPRPQRFLTTCRFKHHATNPSSSSSNTNHRTLLNHHRLPNRVSLILIITIQREFCDVLRCDVSCRSIMPPRSHRPRV